MKILILKPSSLGDVIHAIPVLRLLKSHLPQSEIYWWLDSELAELLEDDPDLTGIIPFHRRRWRSIEFFPEIIDSVRIMRKMRFDLAIDLQGLARSAVFGWLANPGILLGLDNPREGAREGARGFYDLFPPRSPQGVHAVDRYLAILSLVNVPLHWNFQWLPPHPKAAAQVRQKWNPGDTPWLLLLPGARWNDKRWPAESFAQTIRLLAARNPNLRFAVLGAAGDKPLGDTIAQACPERCLNLAGQTTLSETIEWIRLGRLTLSNDTGPMHLAAALRKPVIALFGPTDPRSTGPYGQPGHVLQTTGLNCVPCLKSECHHNAPLACLRALTPAMVCDKIQAML